MPFRWNDWNLEHATKHGVSPEEAESVVDDAQPPYPHARGDQKWCVWGHGVGGRFIQVVYILDPGSTL